MKIAIIFDNFGPYHLARLRAANKVCKLLALEISDHSRDYDWEPCARPREFNSVTLNRTRRVNNSKAARPIDPLRRALVEFAPHCVFIPGWSRGYSLKTLAWCATNKVPAVLMSESTEYDAPRPALKEWLKARIAAVFSAALVGGIAHADYLAKLRIPPDRIFSGYDAVDNDYFTRTTIHVRQQGAELRRKFGLPRHYFLASARFVEKKNLPRLIDAYAAYRTAFADSEGGPIGSEQHWPWSLVLLGDGTGKAALHCQIADKGLERFVLLPGFKRYSELPVYYGLASAFVHPSTSEPWGLVVNEAMASALPVVVSNRCGCAPDLVRYGRNGFTFDPWNVGQLAELMLRISNRVFQRSAMGDASLELISAWGLNRFSDAVRNAAAKAIETGSRNTSAWQAALLRVLMGL